jgi:hypothetical protein
MLGQIIEWFYHDVAGIQFDHTEPGYKKIIIRPSIVGDLTWTEASYESPRGPIAVSWRREGGIFSLEVTIPPNTTATVYVPAVHPEKVTEDGGLAVHHAGVKRLRDEENAAVFSVPSGSYRFSAPVF